MRGAEDTLIGANTASKTASNWTLACGAIALAGLCLLWAAFSVHTATDWLSFPRFLAALLLLFVLPGTIAVRWLHLPLTPVEFLTVATCIGMVVTGTLYGLLVWLGVPALLWIWLLAGVALALYGLRRLRAVVTPPRGEHVLLLLTLVAVWLPILVIVFLGRNLSVTPDGGLTYFPWTTDVALHTAIAGELTHTVPPQVPFLSGQPLSYHLGMDMVTAVLARFGGLSVADLVVRFCPLLFVTLDVLAIFCFARRFLGSGSAGVAAAFLAVLGEDFSFVFGALPLHHVVWSAYYFQLPTIFSIYFVNPMAMGLGNFFAGLFCLYRATTDARRGWTIAAALCLAALVQIKIFLFLQLVLSLLIVSAIELALFRRTTFVRPAIYLALFSLPFAIVVRLSNSEGGNIVWGLSSGLETYVRNAALRIGLPVTGALTMIWLPLYLVGVFGYRVIGAGEIVTALRSARHHAFAFLLAVFVVLGPVLTLTTKIVPADDPTGFNNAGWFFVASKFVAPIFAVAWLMRHWPKADRRKRLAVIALLAAAALPSTLEFIGGNALNSHKPVHWDRGQMAAVGALNQFAVPGQVVLPAMSGIDALLLTMTKLRLPYADLPYSTTVMDVKLGNARRSDVQAFRKAWAEGKLDGDVLTRYGVSWIVTPHRASSSIAQRSRLQPVFDDSAFTIYRVGRPRLPAASVGTPR